MRRDDGEEGALQVIGWGYLSSAPVLELVVVDVFAHVGVDVSVRSGEVGAVSTCASEREMEA